MVKRSFLCWFFGVVYPFFSHFRFQSSFLFFVHLPQVCVAVRSFCGLQ
ncbi:hypothetical protein E1A91_D07G091200v1 [Gossypium mustelinum]|uniref:Uncharacterized protein n=1 Tax=Gossypium mustelinum TaxID=34275 RepID=A0A5D2U5R7_GOSMU|nr:hypothetical protein E1A91_D07G091200v1 [Gossypium mustelinum]